MKKWKKPQYEILRSNDLKISIAMSACSGNIAVAGVGVKSIRIR